MEPESGLINDAITIASNIEKPKPSPVQKWHIFRVEQHYTF